MEFKIEKKLKGKGEDGKDCLGRAGVIKTAHGEIHTPAFVPVGTKASVKALTPEQVAELGAEVVLGNTYHLYLQPEDELVRDAGGMAQFMNWRRGDGSARPTITDSGGFQVFSLGAAFGKDFSKVISITDPSLLIPERADDNLPKLAKIGQDGVSFRSHIDGSLHYITPEKSIEIQHNLGADIIFAFDEATAPGESHAYQAEALERTHRWAKRSLEEHMRLGKEKFSMRGVSQADEPRGSAARARADSDPAEKDFSVPALFGIVQGGLEQDLRRKSAEYIGSLDFDGFGIGGSYTKEHMALTTHLVNSILPEAKPRHLLGIGEPEDLFMGVENGVDLFDCVAPTRNGRNGTLYTKRGKINIVNQEFRKKLEPIEKDCGCYTCRNCTCAYISHLFHGKEMLAATLSSIHNLYFIVNLVKKMRQSILDDNFFEFKKEFLKVYSGKT